MKNYKERYKPIKFPRDEQKHDHTIEWWYFNGNLKTSDGRSFSYMNTLFSAKPKKVQIPFLKQIPLKTLFFSHQLITDNNKHQFLHKVNPVCLVNQDSFTKPLLWVQYDNACLIEETELFNYHLVNDFVDLKMCSVKKPLLIAKRGFIDLQVKTSYYYSLTRLQTTGIIKIDNKWLPVSGLSWFDHQWAQGPLIRGDKWTWFSIQLNNGLDLICFIYGDEMKTFHAGLIDKNNRSRFTNNFVLKTTPLKFRSKETGSVFQLGYELFIPDWGIELKIEPLNKQQEMIFGSINYWEGGIKVNGKVQSQPVAGLGFMELVGSPMKKTALKVYLNKFKKEIFNHPIKRFSKEFFNKLKAYQ